MLSLTADLHIHTVLSPCGELSMSPTTIVARARELGLGLVGCADHNSARNAPALAEAARRAGVLAWFGIEVRTAEEVDVLCVFDEPGPAVEFGEWVYASLPAIPCDPEVFGDQVVVDADEQILELLDKLLISGCAYTIDEVCVTARQAGALVIPAHVDRPRDSLLSQLGFLPDGLVVDAFEVSRFADEEALRAGGCPWLREAPVVRFSDAHRPAEIGYQQTRFELTEPTIAAARAALSERTGRGVTPLRQALRGEAHDGSK